MSEHVITSRIDAITKIPEPYRNTILPAPKAVKIELTDTCNFRCGFCALRTRKESCGAMDRDLYIRLCREMVEAGVEELGVFYIGESFILPWLDEAIAIAKEAGFSYIFITTNGSISTPDKVKACMAAGLNSLKFSFNYFNGMQLKQIANVSPRFFEKIKENIKGARKVRDEGGYNCGIYASSILFDGEQGVLMKEAVEEILPYVDQHYWLPLYSMGAVATEREAELGYKPTAGNQGRIGALRAPLPCWAVFTEGHITAKGMLSACCFDTDGKWAMGDLNVMSFMEGWNSKTFQDLRAAHLARDVSGTVCEDCVAYR